MLILQLLTPQVLSGVKVEDALDNAYLLGMITLEQKNEVLGVIRTRTSGLDVDKWLASMKLPLNAASRVSFLRDF